MVVAGGLLAAAGLWLWPAPAPTTTLRFVTTTPQPSRPALELTFFTGRFGYLQPSPPPSLGERTLHGESVVVGTELATDAGRVRYRGPGIGTGFLSFELGADPAPVVLRPPQTLRGRVGEPRAAWAHGWRCVGLTPIADAEVVLLGGGEHGVELGIARTDSEGRFVIDGIDGALDGLGLRVRATGYALAHQELPRFDWANGPQPVVPLVRGVCYRGQVAAPPEVSPASLRVLARGLPGVEATPAVDGTFELDHVPIGAEVKLLLYGLGAAWTQLPAIARRGETTRVEVVPATIVRGRVVELLERRPLAGALVFCGDEAVRTDADGRFELARLQAGAAEIGAQYDFVDGRRRRRQWTGSQRVTLVVGTPVEGLEIAVTAR